MKGDKKTVLAVVLIIAAIGVVAYQLLGSATSSTKTARSAIAAPTPSPVEPATVVKPAAQQVAPLTTKYEKLIANVSERQLAYRNPDFKNPMSPLVSDASSSVVKAESVSADMITKGYSIKGIIWNDANPLALINDQVVGVGERLDDGALVTEINPTSVKFTKRGNRYVLVLREE